MNEIGPQFFGWSILTLVIALPLSLATCGSVYACGAPLPLDRAIAIWVSVTCAVFATGVIKRVLSGALRP